MSNLIKLEPSISPSNPQQSLNRQGPSIRNFRKRLINHIGKYFDFSLRSLTVQYTRHFSIFKILRPLQPPTSSLLNPIGKSFGISISVFPFAPTKKYRTTLQSYWWFRTKYSTCLTMPSSNWLDRLSLISIEVEATLSVQEEVSLSEVEAISLSMAIDLLFQ